jgi:hypothetical protein
MKEPEYRNSDDGQNYQGAEGLSCQLPRIAAPVGFIVHASIARARDQKVSPM